MQSKLRTILICMAGAGLGAQAYATTPASAPTTTGMITIAGKITESSCSLDSTSPTTVKLPSVNKSLLTDAGSTAGGAGFSLRVTDCSAGVKVSAAFIPGSNVDANGNLVATGADNVQVQLLDKDHRVININTDDNIKQMARAVQVSDTTPVNLQYYLQYYSHEGSAGIGEITATANFQLTYE